MGDSEVSASNITTKLSNDLTIGGIIAYQVISIITIVFNGLAFVIIYRLTACFQQNNGFREMLLSQCVVDALCGVTLHLFSYWKFTGQVFLAYRRITGVILVLFHLLSYGGVLGISLQRLITAKMVRTRRSAWDPKRTLAVYVCNITAVVLLLLLFIAIRDTFKDFSSALITIYIVSVVVITDIFCGLSLMYLKRNLATLRPVGQLPTLAKPTTQHNRASDTMTEAELSRDTTNLTTINTQCRKGTDQVNDEPIQTVTHEVPNATLRPKSCNQLMAEPQHTEPKSNTLTAGSTAHRTDPMISMPAHRQIKSHAQTGRYQRDVARTLAFIVVLLNDATIPSAGVRLVGLVDRSVYPETESSAISLTLTVNSLLNPFVYLLQMKGLRDVVLKKLRRVAVRR